MSSQLVSAWDVGDRSSQQFHGLHWQSSPGTPKQQESVKVVCESCEEFNRQQLILDPSDQMTTVR